MQTVSIEPAGPSEGGALSRRSSATRTARPPAARRRGPMRLIIAATCLALAAALAGCARTCYVTECDLEHYREIGVPPCLEANPAASVVPSASSEPAPPTPDHLNTTIRYLSLAAAIAVAIQQ